MDIQKKILIVDDKPENLVALEKLLNIFNTEIIKAKSGNEALSKTLEHDFALALIDVQMPDMDGYETVKLMRQVERTKLLPVIFLSAIYSENHYLIQGIEAGAVDFITKPIQPRILIGKVKIFLELFEQKKNLEIEIEQRKITEESLLETEKLLLEAKAKAEEADRLKTAFLANMSHEIRTPLNAIVGFANLIIDNNLDNERKKLYASYIFNSSDILTNIISDILDVAKIEAGQFKIEPGSVKINNVLKELWVTFKEILKQKEKDRIELKLVLPDPPITELILTDEVRFRQVLSNLLQNAIKFTLEGYIEFGYTLKNKDVIEFYVKDTGVGIAEDKLSLIFDRFQKVQNEKITNATGTGLGLSIVKKIIEMMGGEIWVESEIKNGSTFLFTIPYLKAIKTSIQVEQSDLKSPGEYQWSDKSLLIAEDEYSNYLLLEELFIPTGINIIWAKNGQEAVDEFLKNKKIEAILMDIKMPIMSGIDAFVEIRKVNPDVPIIAQTAYAMTGEREHLRELGFNAYLNKPINKRELFNILHSFLKQ